MHTEWRPHHMTSELLKVILQNFNKYIILSEQQEEPSTHFFFNTQTVHTAGASHDLSQTSAGPYGTAENVNRR